MNVVPRRYCLVCALPVPHRPDECVNRYLPHRYDAGDRRQHDLGRDARGNYGPANALRRQIETGSAREASS